jgi:two-component system, response regulator
VGFLRLKSLMRKKKSKIMENNAVQILLVEDNADEAGMTIRALKKHHLSNHMLHLRDGEEALNFLFSKEPSDYPKLILLDIKMPKVDGLEVLRRIKSDSELKIIPVVLLTSSKEDRDILESYKLGVNAYIVKPVDFEKFVVAVTEVGYFWLVLNQPPT